MASSFTLKSKPKPLTAHVDKLAKELPFVLAKALTATAMDAQQIVRGNLKRRFKLRSSWLQKGIRIRPAKKRELELGAAVYTLDSFMVLQETGGTKRPKSGRHIAIPEEKNIKRRAGGGVQKKMRPRAVMTQGSRFKGFEVTLGGQRFIAMHSKKKVLGKRRMRGKTGRLRKARRRFERRLKILYALSPLARVRKRFKFEADVRRVYNRTFHRRVLLGVSRI